MSQLGSSSRKKKATRDSPLIALLTTQGLFMFDRFSVNDLYHPLKAPKAEGIKLER